MLMRRFHNNQKGVSAIEFALVLPVLLLFLGGTIDFGIIFFINHIAGNAAREGARLAAASDPIVPAAIRARTEGFLHNTAGLFRDVVTTVPSAPPPVSDCEVAVNVSGEVPYFFLTIFPKAALGSAFPINRTVTLHYEHCGS